MSGKDLRKVNGRPSRRDLEKSVKEGKSPVDERQSREAEIQSTTKHEEFCGKQGGPPSKAKNYLATDSA